eukprot:TRINITY_DN2134_c0_g1_i2.p1 TRINITY_DN2134_c0_g1~~TRINITY_DN2134_c0_g1_i2.p1  ORF type:complete len:523 (+),score=129.75 TRINITY_DN2134_c0_g1_i2:60-1571(+)
MVVLSVALCTKSGKTLVSRQFVDMNRGRIEGLLAAFPKLMGSEKQHTYIETESVRYVYQPLESLYLLLITVKNSNILEDLGTLSLLAKTIPEYCRVLEEDEITKNAFELIFVFDEIIAQGYREKITAQQVKLFLEMDSHEEKIHEMVERNKQREAKEEAKRRQHLIEKERSENAKKGFSGGMGGGGGYYNPSAMSSDSAAPFVIKEQKAPEPISKPDVASGPKKGMILGKKKGDDTFLKALAQEDQIVVEPTKSQPQQAVAKENVNITVEEKLVLSIADGGVQNVEVKGDLVVYISDPNFTRINIKVSGDNTGRYQIQAHPKINKPLYAQDRVLALKDAPFAFPAGSAVRLLRWRAQSKDEALVPLTVNCWPTNESDGTTTVNMEYQLNSSKFALRDVSIVIPVPVRQVVVNQVDGESKVDPKIQALEWNLPLIDSSNNTGSMEFALPFNGDNSAFFPIHVHFKSNTTFCPIEVEQVSMIENGQPVKYAQNKVMEVEQYEIVS